MKHLLVILALLVSSCTFVLVTGDNNESTIDKETGVDAALDAVTDLSPM